MDVLSKVNIQNLIDITVKLMLNFPKFIKHSGTLVFSVLPEASTQA